MANLKMAHSGLESVNEIEQLQPCMYFGKGLCPSCYAELQYPMRQATSRHTHRKTTRHGVLRLGTFIECTEEHWNQFKAGEGTWLCCGEKWSRPDFPKRTYYFITRGLQPKSFYDKVLADPLLDNIQVSVDCYPELDFEVLPDRERLKYFVSHDNVMLRYKTTEANAQKFIELSQDIGLPNGRISIMETPLRLPKKTHYYRTTTPLEKAGWTDTQSYGRCNSKCDDCVGENGVLLCAARAPTLKRLVDYKRPPPVRLVFPQMKSNRDIIWRKEAALAMVENGGTITVKDAYDWILRKYPILEEGKSSYTFKMRVALQRAGYRQCPNCATKIISQKFQKGVKSSPVYNCPTCNTKLPPGVWTVRPELVPEAEASLRAIQGVEQDIELALPVKSDKPDIIQAVVDEMQ